MKFRSYRTPNARLRKWQLIKMAKRRHLPYSNRRKENLRATIHEYDARNVISGCIRRQRQNRAAVVITRCVRRYITHKPINSHDPITMEPLSASCFKIIAPDGTVTGYDASVLRQYIEETSCTIDPLNRREFTEVELQRLCRATGANKLHIKCADERRKQCDFENTCTTLESQIAEILDNLVESLEHSTDLEMTLTYVYSAIPMLMQFIFNYHSTSQYHCTQHITHCIMRLRRLKVNGIGLIVDMMTDMYGQLHRG